MAARDVINQTRNVFYSCSVELISTGHMECVNARTDLLDDDGYAHRLLNPCFERSRSGDIVETVDHMYNIEGLGGST